MFLNIFWVNQTLENPYLYNFLAFSASPKYKTPHKQTSHGCKFGNGTIKNKKAVAHAQRAPQLSYLGGENLLNDHWVTYHLLP